jgi:hypothetical protein
VLLQQLREAGAGATAEGLRAAYKLAETGSPVLPKLLEVLSEQAAQMTADMGAWVPYFYRANRTNQHHIYHTWTYNYLPRDSNETDHWVH